MKLNFTIDTEYRTLTVDISRLPTLEQEVDALRQARLYAGMLFPHVVFLEILRTPAGEREPVNPAATEG